MTTRFFHRLFGILALDASIYEEVEADRSAGLESIAVILLVMAAAGIGVIGIGIAGVAGFIAGAVIALGGWLVWVSLIATLGTTALAEPQTRSNTRELQRTLGYAAAPGLFLVFAAVRPAAPFIFTLVSIWMIAAAVLAVRQALDFRNMTRAITVCVLSWMLSVGVLVLIAFVFVRPAE